MKNNYVSDLTAILAPPHEPLDLNHNVLVRNEAILRINFPSDFVEFGKIYGSGTIHSAYSWEVWSPYRSTFPLIVLEFSRVWHLFKFDVEIDEIPFGIYPEVGGLLPFATTGNGGWVCWITEGEPQDWRVVEMQTYESGGYEAFQLSFSEYFFRLLNRELIPDYYQGGDPWSPKSDLVFSQDVYFDQNY